MCVFRKIEWEKEESTRGCVYMCNFVEEKMQNNNPYRNDIVDVSWFGVYCQIKVSVEK